jgi:hypothetical protein
VLRSRQLNIADPETHGRLGNANTPRNLIDGKTVLAAKVASKISLFCFHN